MKTLLRIEEAFLGVLSLSLFLALDYAWWWFFVLLLAPDLGMIGYLINPRMGAVTYDILHHKGIAILLFIAGALLGVQWVQAMGLILLGHSSFDRALDYGLKYPDSFQHTHLGMIGRASAG